MNTEKKIELLAEILDVEATEITPETELSEFENWDSVGVLSFIAMVYEEFDKEVKGADIKQFVTVQDALNVME